MASDAVNAPLGDKIATMQQKVKLIEGELRANEDSAQSTIAQNIEAISELRQRNTELRRELVRFHATHHRIVSGNMAVPMLREESMSKTKQLNNFVHATQQRRQRLHNLRMEYLALKPGRRQAEERGRRIQEEERKRRGLDNSLAQARLRFQDAERISEGYFRIKQELQLEGYSFQNQLDCLDTSILEEREELCNLRAANGEARRSTEAAETELRQLEERLSREHEERERVLECQRTQVQESKARAEQAIQAAVKSHHKFQLRGAFRHLRAVTQLSNSQETVERFVVLWGIRSRLEKIWGENDEFMQALRNDTVVPLDLAHSELRYSTAKYRAEEERNLVMLQNKLCEAESRRVMDKSNLEKLIGTLGNVGPIVNCIADKLVHISLDSDSDSEDDGDDDYDDGRDSSFFSWTHDVVVDQGTTRQPKAKKKKKKKKKKTTSVQEDEVKAPPVSTGNYWTDLQNTFKSMVVLLGQCASKLLRLHDDTTEEERRRAKRKAKRPKAPEWKAPKRQNSATTDHIKRLKELEKEKKRKGG